MITFLLGVHADPILRNSTLWLEDWMLLLGVVLLAILGWVRVHYPKRLIQVAESITKERILKQTMREEFLLSHQASFVYIILYLAISGLLFYLFSKNLGITLFEADSSLQVLAFVAIAGILLLIRSLGLKLLRILAQGDYGLEQYHFHSFLCYMLLGVGAFPFVFLSLFLSPEYAQYLLWVVILAGLAFYIFRIFWGVREARLQGVPWHYLILYLCTLEILPVIVLTKFVLDLLNPI